MRSVAPAAGRGRRLRALSRSPQPCPALGGGGRPSRGSSSRASAEWPPPSRIATTRQNRHHPAESPPPSRIATTQQNRHHPAHPRHRQNVQSVPSHPHRRVRLGRRRLGPTPVGPAPLAVAPAKAARNGASALGPVVRAEGPSCGQGLLSRPPPALGSARSTVRSRLPAPAAAAPSSGHSSPTASSCPRWPPRRRSGGGPPRPSFAAGVAPPSPPPAPGAPLVLADPCRWAISSRLFGGSPRRNCGSRKPAALAGDADEVGPVKARGPWWARG